MKAATFRLMLLAAVLCVGALLPRPAAAADHRVSSVRIYLVNTHAKGPDCGRKLVGIKRQIKPTPAPLTAALRLLLKTRQVCGGTGLCSAFSRSDLHLRRAVVTTGTASIHLTGTLSLGGICDNPRVRGQLTSTAMQFSSIHAVRIYINNRSLSEVLSQR